MSLVGSTLDSVVPGLLFGVCAVLGLSVLVFKEEFAAMQCKRLSRLLGGRIEFSPTFFATVRNFDVVFAVLFVGTCVAGLVWSI